MTRAKVPDNPAAARDEMARSLATALGRVRRAALLRDLAAGGRWGLLMAAGLSVLQLLLRLGAWLGLVSPAGWGLYAVGVVVVVLAALSYAVAFGEWRSVSLREAAERLDLEQSQHNRVAIAWSLLNNRPRGHGLAAFESAAVEDGMRLLREVAERSCALPESRLAWRRNGRMAAWTLVLVVFALLVPPRMHPGRGDFISSAEASVAVPHGKLAADRPQSGEETKPPAHDEQASTGGGTRASEPNGGKNVTLPRPSADASSTRAERATGQAGRQGMQRSGAASSAGAAAAEGGESSKSPVTRQRSGKSREAPEPQATERRGPQDKSESSSGTAGGGRVSTARDSAGQQSRTDSEEQEADDSEEKVEDERSANKQRGGVQPSLKDRRESPSRELGLSGTQGPPGTGRGGPTPPKKSRGTASLVLGVPLPDFVKGRLGPGSTRVNYEQVMPSPMPGDPARAVPVRPRRLPEQWCPRFEVPPALATTVRDYLVGLHSADREPAAGAPASGANVNP